MDVDSVSNYEEVKSSILEKVLFIFFFFSSSRCCILVFCCLDTCRSMFCEFHLYDISCPKKTVFSVSGIYFLLGGRGVHWF